MTLEQLKQKASKRQTESKEIQKQIKEEEAARKKAEEAIQKLSGLSSDIAKVVQNMLDKAGIALPEGKEIIIKGSETGLITNIIETKNARIGRGNGGVKAITYEGKNMSWSKLCDLKGIAKTLSGSAHRDVYNKAKEIHDSIPHVCIIDGKTYPVTQS